MAARLDPADGRPVVERVAQWSEDVLVVRVSRGIGPRALILNHYPDHCVATPHNASFCNSLVLLARQAVDPSSIILTAQALVIGEVVETDQITLLRQVASKSAGLLTLVRLRLQSPWPPRPFRALVPIVGSTKGAHGFRGEKGLLLSVVELQWRNHVAKWPPAPRLEAILNREERFAANPTLPSITVDWMGLQLHVSEHVLRPRAGSMAVVEAAVEACRQFDQRSWRVLDWGTGSGCLLLGILSQLTMATGVGYDIDAKALAVARRNAGSLGMDFRTEWCIHPFANRLEEDFDVVVCNPPYRTRGGRHPLDATALAAEPRHALVVEGLDWLVYYRQVLGNLTACVEVLVLEVFRDNVEHVERLCCEAGWTNVQRGRDSQCCIRTITCLR